MLCHMSHITEARQMARGRSGKIVVDIDPALKDRLYVQLAQENLTLKEWLIRQIERYLADRVQPPLFPDTPPAARKSGEAP